MLVQDKKMTFQGNVLRLNYNLKNKVMGSTVRCPIVATKNGVELTQAEYDTAAGLSVSLSGDVLYTVSFASLINDLYAGDVAAFKAAVASMTLFGSNYVFNNTTQAYVSINNITSGFADYIKADGTMLVKKSNTVGFQMYMIVNKAADAIRPIKSDLTATWVMALQNVGLAPQLSGIEEKTLLSIVEEGAAQVVYANYNFSDGLVPAEFTQSGQGAQVGADPLNASNKCISFKNKGIDGSAASFTMTVGNGVTGPYNVELDFLTSSESGYDYFTIYVNGTVKFKVSGSASVSTNAYGWSGLSGSAWNHGVMEGLTGVNTIKFEYSKDGSAANGYDNAYIDNIKVCSAPPAVLQVVWSPSGYSKYVCLRKNGAIVASASLSSISSNTPAGVILNIELEQTATDLILRVLPNNDASAIKATAAGKALKVKRHLIYPLAKFNDAGYVPSTEQPAVADAISIVKNKNYTDAEALNILKGIAQGFIKPNIKSGYLVPSVNYSITGTATLQSEEVVKRTITNSSPVTAAADEIRIGVQTGAVVKQYN